MIGGEKWVVENNTRLCEILQEVWEGAKLQAQENQIVEGKFLLEIILIYKLLQFLKIRPICGDLKI